MSTTPPQTALWKPTWHELDQAIAVGLQARFRFFKDVSNELLRDHDVQWIFYNRLDGARESEIRFVTIVEIYHDFLGGMSAVETHGLDYLFHLLSGNPVRVNAEETPGRSPEHAEIVDWSLRVRIRDISEPLPEDV